MWFSVVVLKRVLKSSTPIINFIHQQLIRFHHYHRFISPGSRNRHQLSLSNATSSSPSRRADSHIISVELDQPDVWVAGRSAVRRDRLIQRKDVSETIALLGSIVSFELELGDESLGKLKKSVGARSCLRAPGWSLSASFRVGE